MYKKNQHLYRTTGTSHLWYSLVNTNKYCYVNYDFKGYYGLVSKIEVHI